MDLPSSFKQHSVWSLDHHSSSHTVLQHTSGAQVARWVSPLRGVTNTCGLKPEGKGKQKRRNPLTVRLSDNERELIRTRAEETGVSLNAYIRSSILGSQLKPNGHQLEALRVLMRNFVIAAR